MATDVRRDGKTQKTYDSGNQTEDENSAFHWLLKHQGQSVEWALKYEGWEFAEIPSSPEPRVSAIYRGREHSRPAYSLMFSATPDQRSGSYGYDGAIRELQVQAGLDPEAARDLVSAATVDRMATHQLSEETARG
jgi:hypothetical protein